MRWSQGKARGAAPSPPLTPELFLATSPFAKELCFIFQLKYKSFTFKHRPPPTPSPYLWTVQRRDRDATCCSTSHSWERLGNIRLDWAVDREARRRRAPGGSVSPAPQGAGKTPENRLPLPRGALRAQGSARPEGGFSLSGAGPSHPEEDGASPPPPRVPLTLGSRLDTEARTHRLMACSTGQEAQCASGRCC